MQVLNEFYEMLSLTEVKAVIDTSAYTMIIVGFITFFATSLITAPYGKFSASKGWGILVHPIFAWMIMESPNLILSLLLYIESFQFQAITDIKLPIEQLPNQILLLAFCIHYFNRSIIFPIFLSKGHPMPFSVMFLAFVYCSWNGFNQAVSLIYLNHFPEDWFFHWQFILGISLFVYGLMINIQSDHYLLSLKSKAIADGEEYIIPKKGFFRYVTSANYFGEILEWIGFALACNSLPAWAFAFYTFTNLGPRAQAHHLWYQQKFAKYPKDRKAIIPFIW